MRSTNKIDINNKSNEIREKEMRSIEKTRKIIERSVLKDAEKKELNLSKNLANIEESRAFLDMIDKNLKMNEESNYNNSRRQFEEWNINVHGKIQMEISKQLNKIHSKDLNKKKNEDYEKFLDISNNKLLTLKVNVSRDLPSLARGSSVTMLLSLLDS